MRPAKAPEGARCVTHPDRPAVDTCTRCGAFVCGECGEVFEDTLYCAACFALLRPQEVSRRARWALWLALGALAAPVGLLALKAIIVAPLVGLALGLSAAITSRVELLAIARQEAPRGGLRRARVALGLGLLAVLLSLAATVLAVLVVSSIVDHD